MEKQQESIGKIKEQQENIKNLMKLVQDNPELEIKPMVDSEIVSDSGCSYWLGGWGDAVIDEYWVSDEKIYFKRNDLEELIEDFIDINSGEYRNLSDKELEKVATERVNNYAWKKAIVVYIETP